MPTNITAVDTFTDPVVAPADGDSVTGSAPETMGQGLANRTLNNKNRIDGHDTDIAAIESEIDDLSEWQAVNFSSSPIANNVSATMSSGGGFGSYSFSSGNLVFPSVGDYLIAGQVRFTVNDATNPLVGTAMEFQRSTDSAVYRRVHAARYSATTGEYMTISFAFGYDVTDVAQHLTLVNKSGQSITMDANSFSSQFIARRIR